MLTGGEDRGQCCGATMSHFADGKNGGEGHSTLENTANAYPEVFAGLVFVCPYIGTTSGRRTNRHDEQQQAFTGAVTTVILNRDPA